MAAFLASTAVDIMIDNLQSAEERVSQAILADLRSFELEATEFNTRFGSFAVHLMDESKVDIKQRRIILENLTAQYSKVGALKEYLSTDDQVYFLEYQEDLIKVKQAIENTDDVLDLREAYEAVGALLDTQENMVRLMRVKAGVLSRRDLPSA